MIKLGMTDCPALRALLQRGALELDYIEVHGPHAAAARQAYPQAPMLLHNALYQWSLAHPEIRPLPLRPSLKIGASQI